MTEGFFCWLSAFALGVEVVCTWFNEGRRDVGDGLWHLTSGGRLERRILPRGEYALAEEVEVDVACGGGGDGEIAPARDAVAVGDCTHAREEGDRLPADVMRRAADGPAEERLRFPWRYYGHEEHASKRAKSVDNTVVLGGVVTHCRSSPPKLTSFGAAAR